MHFNGNKPDQELFTLTGRPIWRVSIVWSLSSYAILKSSIMLDMLKLVPKCQFSWKLLIVRCRFRQRHAMMSSTCQHFKLIQGRSKFQTTMNLTIMSRKFGFGKFLYYLWKHMSLFIRSGLLLMPNAPYLPLCCTSRTMCWNSCHFLTQYRPQCQQKIMMQSTMSGISIMSRKVHLVCKLCFESKWYALYTLKASLHGNIFRHFSINKTKLTSGNIHQ